MGMGGELRVGPRDILRGRPLEGSRERRTCWVLAVWTLGGERTVRPDGCRAGRRGRGPAVWLWGALGAWCRPERGLRRGRRASRAAQAFPRGTARALSQARPGSLKHHFLRVLPPVGSPIALRNTEQENAFCC